MAERAVNGLQRILGPAIGFRLAETDVGQFALDDVDNAGVHRRGGAVGLRLLSASAARLACCRFEMVQDVLQPVLDAAEIAGARIGRASRSAPADTRPAVRDGQRPTHCRCRPACGRCVRTGCASRLRRCSELLARGRPLAAFDRRGQRGDALFQHWRRSLVAGGARQLVDLGRQQHARLRKAAPARRWRRRWRRSSEAPRSRLRADAPSTGSSLARRIRSSLAPRLRIASS